MQIACTHISLDTMFLSRIFVAHYISNSAQKWCLSCIATPFCPPFYKGRHFYGFVVLLSWTRKPFHVEVSLEEKDLLQQ